MEINKELIEKLKETLPEGIEIEDKEAYTIEDLSNVIASNFVPKSDHDKEVKRVFGEARGKGESKLKKLLGDEIKDLETKDFDTLIGVMEQKVTSLSNKVQTLEAAGKPSEAIEKQMSEYQKMVDDLNKALESKDNEIQNAKTESEMRIQNFIINQEIKRVYDSQPWVSHADDYLKTGVWKKEIEGKYEFKKDGDKIVVYEGENIVKKGMKPITVDDFFASILEKTNTIKKNNGGEAQQRPAGGKEVPNELQEHLNYMKGRNG